MGMHMHVTKTLASICYFDHTKLSCQTHWLLYMCYFDYVSCHIQLYNDKINRSVFHCLSCCHSDYYGSYSCKMLLGRSNATRFVKKNPIIRLVGIMLQILTIILFRISSKKLSKCFYYSQVSLIMLKFIPSFSSFAIK